MPPAGLAAYGDTYGLVGCGVLSFFDSVGEIVGWGLERDSADAPWERDADCRDFDWSAEVGVEDERVVSFGFNGDDLGVICSGVGGSNGCRFSSKEYLLLPDVRVCCAE